MVTNQYDIFITDLDPTQGHEIQKTRPCVIISPNEMNHFIGTVIIAPMTTKSKSYPSRVSIEFQEKQGWIVLDQIRTVDKSRLKNHTGSLDEITIQKVKDVLKQMLVD